MPSALKADSRDTMEQVLAVLKRQTPDLSNHRRFMADMGKGLHAVAGLLTSTFG
jgi:hypothetical protein